MTYTKYGWIIDDAVPYRSPEYERKLRDGWMLFSVDERGIAKMGKRETQRSIKGRLFSTKRNMIGLR